MKKEKFLKVGLSVLCTAVLAACGGSDDDTPSPTNTPTPTNTATTTPTATPTSMPTPSAIPTTQAGAQLTEAERAARAEQLSEEKNAYVAMQQAKKINSDVDETTGTPTSNATLQRVSQTKLVPALDTIVVAVPSNNNSKVTYLEDFQFNNNQGLIKATSTPSANMTDVTTFDKGTFVDKYKEVKTGVTDIDGTNGLQPLTETQLKKHFDKGQDGIFKYVYNSLSSTAHSATNPMTRAEFSAVIKKVRDELMDYANGAGKYSGIIDPLGRVEARKAAESIITSASSFGTTSGPYNTSVIDPTAVSEQDVFDKLTTITDNGPSGESFSTAIGRASGYTAADYYAEMRKYSNTKELKQLVEEEIARGNRLNDSTGNKERYVQSRKDGKTTLNHIYLRDQANSSASDNSTANDISTFYARQSTYDSNLGPTNKYGSTYTETNTQGTRTGEALVYQAGRRVYITDDGTPGRTFGYVRKTDVAGTEHQYNRNGTTIAKGDGTHATAGTGILDPNRNQVRQLKDTVAEVYGNKTFTYEVGKTNANYTDNFVNDGGNNAPFTGAFNKKTGYYDSKELKHVQYGRVTSAISGLQPSDLKAGVVDKTVVGIYGKYGQDGTENTYFARGNNRTSNADIAKLSGNLTYSGHAVAYGLDNSFNQIAAVPQGQIPNAIGAQAASSGYQLWSGNHVEATIDTSKKTVSGAISNIWSDGKTETNGNLNIKRVDLVKFNGDFGANGNMIGTSEIVTSDTGTNKSAALNKNLTDEERKGTFHAALFGSNGEEMAGNVKSSSNEAEKAWGAAFGAAQVQGSPWATQISQ